MTKKTNSLLFRFGISTLWKNKTEGIKNIINITQLESIIYKELKKKNFILLHVIYKMYLVNIFLYNCYKFDNKYKNQIIYYYKKTLSLKKTIEKFGLNEKIILWLLNSVNIKIVNLTLHLTNILLINFFFKFFFLCKTHLKFNNKKY